MKVFICKRHGGYSGGLAVVAANTRDEAFEVLHSHKDYEWMLDNVDFKTECVTNDIKRSDSYYYRREDWYEVSNLTADTMIPRIIAEGGHTE